MTLLPILIALLLGVCHADPHQVTLRTGTGAVVARVPVSPGVHAGVATQRPPQQRRQWDKPNDGERKHSWVQQTIDAAGQKACLKAVHMIGLMASEVYVAGEGGIVLRANVTQATGSTAGGGAAGGGSLASVQHYETVLNAGFPHYYYGVASTQEGGVLVSGFIDGAGPSGPVSSGVVRSSYDFGDTWNEEMTIDDKHWAGGPIVCTNASHCVLPGASTNKLYVTNAGIVSMASDFHSLVPSPKVGWFAGPFVAHGPRDGDDQAVSLVISGLGLCSSNSTRYQDFSCQKPIDPVFDGGIALVLGDDPSLSSSAAAAAAPTSATTYTHGMVGGGEISAPMSGEPGVSILESAILTEIYLCHA
jgi:hypothetical protein